MIRFAREARSVRWVGFAALTLLWTAAPPVAEGAGGQEASAEVRQLLERGQEQLDHMQPAAAAETFRCANAVADSKCLACVLGLSRALPGSSEEPIAATREAIKRLDGDPLLGRAYCQLGDLLLLQDAPSAAVEAERAYEKAAGLGGTYRAEGLVGIAEARLRRELYTQAAEAALQAIQASPDDGRAGQARSAICRARRAGNLTPQAAPMPPAEPGPAVPLRVRNPDQPLAGDGPFRIQAPITKPRKIYAPLPIYPGAARKTGAQGVVILEAVIDQDGCVTAPHVLKRLTPGLDKAAVDALWKWAFAPATLEGRPVKVYYTLTVTFQVEESLGLGAAKPPGE